MEKGMAIRDILTGIRNETLRKISREVTSVNPRVLELLDDMKETLKKAQGAGLAAPQVGILKRVVVIDIGEGAMELINPKIISQEGEQFEPEGCLSLPDLVGRVTRPEKIVFTALNREGNEKTYTGDKLLAKVICHEIDHLNGVLFADKAVFEEEDEQE